ncbi:MAG: hypothetical protein IPH13_05465 [Planctomycetes bacterium]|nr:hypothetical protein [Planctomycetota bacterium]MCC7170366.1 hypothetical protein [Planctomycetota bacterium]
MLRLGLAAIVVASLGLGVARATPQFSAPQALPGDDLVLPSAGNQDEPAIAFGPGTSLVVWEDDRSSLVDTVFGGQASGSAVPGNFDICGVILDANGQPTTPAPFVVNGDSWDQLDPRVAWNGTNYLVVFKNTKPTQFFYSAGIYGVRVSPSGVVLDTTPIKIDDDDNYDEMFPAVASQGSDWLVSWTDLNVSVTAIRGAVVSATGVVSSSQILVNGASGQVPTQVELAASGNRYLMVYALNYGGQVRGRLFDVTGAAVGSVFTIDSGFGRQPAVAGNGVDFFVSWLSGSFARGTLVGTNGAVAVPGGLDLGPSAGGANGETGVGWDGVNWTIAFDGNPAMYVAKCDAAGQVLFDGQSFHVSPRSLVNVAVGSGAGRTQIVWTDRQQTINSFGGDHDDVFGATISQVGIPGPITPISVSTPAQIRTQIAGDAQHGFLVVYESLVAGTTTIMAHHVDAYGQSLGAPFAVHSSDRSISFPEVGFNGNEFLVAWQHIQSTLASGPPRLIECKRVLADGTLLDPAPVVVMEGSIPAIDAIGDTFIVVAQYHHQVLQSNSVIRYRRRSGASGAFVDAGPVVLKFGAGNVDVVAMNDRWLVMWGNVAGLFVLADGTATPSFVAADTNASGTWFSLSRNAAQDEAVLTFQYNSSLFYLASVRMRRFDANGVSADPLAGIVVNDAHQAQLRPVGLALDDEYLVHWADHRDFLDYEPGISDVYAARLGTNGAVLDPTGIAIHDDPSGEGNTAVALAGAGRALVAVSDLRDVGFGSYRIACHTYSTGASKAWQAYGNGLAGTKGVPILDGEGTLQPNSAMELVLGNAAPNALSAIVIGTSAAQSPLLGGTLLAAPNIVLVGFDTGALGRWTLGATWPSGIPSGIALHFQVWVPDAAAPFGTSATRGLSATTP